MRRADPGILKSLWTRVLDLLNGSSGRTLQFTGVLGLVAIFLLFYRKRSSGPPKRSSQTSPTNPNSVPAPSGNALSLGQKNDETSQVQASSQVSPSLKSISSQVRARLGGLRTITISAPGILLEERTPYELQRGATLKQEAKEVFREILKNSAVYLIAQVEGDEGEASCRGLFEAEGFIGDGAGQIPAQRLLFCSTLEGKSSIVRQIEPQLHFDGHPTTIEELKRFMRLVHITGPGQQPAGRGYSNTQHAISFSQYFS